MATQLTDREKKLKAEIKQLRDQIKKLSDVISRIHDAVQDSDVIETPEEPRRYYRDDETF